jgi:hypothetical protein
MFMPLMMLVSMQCFDIGRLLTSLMPPNLSMGIFNTMECQEDKEGAFPIWFLVGEKEAW